MLLIRSIRDIVSENPIDQVWKSLRYFLDVDSVSNTIRQFHKIPEEKHKSDIRKQAQQVGTCVRQAEEYFKASSNVTLATRPLLLYYGAVCLSQALVLLRQDGNLSLDKLRKNKKHRHHGLELDYGKAERLGKCKSPDEFFLNLQCFIFVKPEKLTDSTEETKQIPWGHFNLVYTSLALEAFHYKKKEYEAGRSTHLESMGVQACADILGIESLVGKSLNAFALIKTLPDMFFNLTELGILPDICRGSLDIDITKKYINDEHGTRVLGSVSEEHKFFVDGVTEEQKKDFLSFYQTKNPELKILDDHGRNIVLKYKIEYVPSEDPIRKYYPDIAEDLNGRKFYILKPDQYLPETATYLALLFCFGYLARYYQDQWVTIIDTKVRIAEMIDSILNIAYRKFPNLMLDQMTLIKHHIHL